MNAVTATAYGPLLDTAIAMILGNAVNATDPKLARRLSEQEEISFYRARQAIIRARRMLDDPNFQPNKGGRPRISEHGSTHVSASLTQADIDRALEISRANGDKKPTVSAGLRYALAEYILF